MLPMVAVAVARVGRSVPAVSAEPALPLWRVVVVVVQSAHLPVVRRRALLPAVAVAVLVARARLVQALPVPVV